MFNDNDVKIEEMDLNGEFTGKSIEEAKDKAAAQFGVSVTEIYFQIVNDVKKGLFGKVKEEAKVLAGYNRPTEDDTAEAAAVTSETETKAAQTSDSEISEEQIACVKKYLENIIEKMGIDAGVTVEVREGVFYVDIDSKGSGAVIGRRGETLDALQYLTSLVANKWEGEYKRVTINSCGYREKREETLVSLANKIGQKALRTGRATTLEPMNPYERRIIHSAVAKIDGVSSKSVGEEPYRKVVISSDNPRRNDRRGGGYKKKRNDGPRSLDLKTSFEKDYKKPKPEDNINAGLYGKIEI